MLLRKLTIENFRGLKKLELALDRTTVLIGENNCGKTSILEAIRLCLSRAVRGNPFDDHDYHLDSAKANPGDAGVLRVTLDFSEERMGDWPPDLIQAIPDAMTIDNAGLYHIIFSVTSSYDQNVKDFTTNWEFQDTTGKALPKAKKSSVLASLQNLFYVYYLTAFRDATRDFSPKSSFWGPFLRNPSIPDAIKTQLETELGALNTKIVNAEQRLKQVSANLGKAQKVVTLGQTDTVSIDALPSRIWDMLSRAQVNVAAVTGASLPLLKHGAGTQSLASIFLFEAFLSAGIDKPDPLTSYLLQIEEPEAHLHPSAIRSLWPTLAASTEQKIIATHSGDLLSEVPLSSVRRLSRTNAGVEVRSFDATQFDPDDLRKITFHIRSNRGELLFARVWLLHEGQTEYWMLHEAARIGGISLEEKGVRLIEYAPVGLAPLLKLPDQFGIAWHCVCDADPQGVKNANSATAALNGRNPLDHLTALPSSDMELFLCSVGFGSVYEANVAPQKSQLITSKPGAPDYWTQVLSAQPKSFKIPCAIKIIEVIEKGGAGAIPATLLDILNKSVALGGK